MKYYEHPEYIGFAEGIPATDTRHAVWEEQFKERGFDDTVTWSLDYSLCQWILPRLKEYEKVAFKVIDAPDLHKDVKKMIEGFELAADESTYFNGKKEDQEKIQEAFDTFAKVREGLWW